MCFFLLLSVRYLVQFLSLLSEQQAVNKMTPSNIAIVLGPNLLWPRAEGCVVTCVHLVGTITMLHPHMCTALLILFHHVCVLM